MDGLPGTHPAPKRRLLLTPMRCGTCRDPFTADPGTVPTLHGAVACRRCWDRACHLQMAMGLPPWPRRACYPTDDI